MSNREAIKRLLGLLIDYKKTILFIICCLLITTGLNLGIPLLSKNIMDQGFIGGNKQLLIKLVIITSLVYIVNSFLDIIKEKKRIGISAKIEYSLSEQAFTHLMKLKSDYFCKTNYAEILNNISEDIGNITAISDSGMFFVVTQVFSITGGIIGLCIINFKLTLLVLLFIPIKYLVIKYLAKKRKTLMDEYMKENQEYANWFGDTVGGVHEVKLFNIFKNKKEEFEKKQKIVINKKMKMNMLGEWNMAADVLMVQLLAMAIYIVGANMVFNLRLSVGSVFAFITYSAYVTNPISAILNIGYLLSGIIPSTKRFYEFMSLAEEQDKNNTTLHPKFGDLELRNVSFSYEIDKPILKEINIKFARGSKTALIGKNGSGKSTIIGLLTRMYETEIGKIFLDGNNILEYPLNKYRSMISVVSQQIYLFNDTIRNNICLYKSIDENEIMQAITDCGLKEFIEEVSIEYIVGQNGAMLSGGQKQKIALARAILHNKQIILFDEATSSTDFYSEMQINSLLESRLKDKTVIVVTHKQGILKEMDQIITIDNGCVVNCGKYAELSNKM